MSVQRLDKIISSQTNLSRKDVKSAIRKKLALVNGNAVKDSGYLVNLEKDSIVFDGQAIKYKEFIYILMNKPKGILSASRDKKQKTVIDLVPPDLQRNNLFPVGRLDQDTTGLLIITNDGEFAHKVISPKKNIYKTYIAQLDGIVIDETVEVFARGVVLADGTVCRKAYLKPLNDYCVEIKICEGRFHQIKRMFGTVGLGVNRLERTAIGGLKLPENIAEGDCRELSKNEISMLFD